MSLSYARRGASPATSFLSCSSLQRELSSISEGTGRTPSPGSLIVSFMYISSCGWMRSTNSFGPAPKSFGSAPKRPRLKPSSSAKMSPGVDLSCTRISLRRSSKALPAFNMKGTPSHRSLRTFKTTIAYVGVRESFGTEAFSLYPGRFSGFFASATYWPATTSVVGTTFATCLSTFSLASRISSGSKLTGRSIASTAMICNKWFCITSRTMPCLSKYSAVVPRSSLKTICTFATFSRFQIGVNILFANRITSKLSMTSFPRYRSMRYRSRSAQCNLSDTCIVRALIRSLPNGFSTTILVQPFPGLRPLRWIASAAGRYSSCGMAR
mmetsp:Transcript_1561/g.6280  ORF Transcript_1561/g.6280 Transcript_1561/m.6280 type:complete len:325 (-) Transcript_1561:414-1388(-)